MTDGERFLEQAWPKCLLAMLLAAISLSSLEGLGLVGRTGPCVADGGGYSRCAIWQDMRSLMHFMLGAFASFLWRASRDPPRDLPDGRSDDGVGKEALHTCLLW